VLYTRPVRLTIALAAVLTAGCRQVPTVGDSEALAVRLTAADPVEASVLIEARAATGCDGLAVALEALGIASQPAALTAALTDEAIAAARSKCADPATTVADLRGPAAYLARSRLAREPEAALAALGGGAGAAIEFRRAEILFELGRRKEAIAAARAGLADQEDAGWRIRLIRALLEEGATEDAARATVRLPATAAGREARIDAFAAAGQGRELAAAIAAAPIEERLDLSRRAAAATLDVAALDAAPPELLRAVAERTAETAPAAAVELYVRAAAASPEDADVLAGYARSLVAAGRLDEALGAWDRARAIAPPVPSLAIDPIEALAAAGRRREAWIRAGEIAASAETDAELVVASAAATAAGDHRLALAVARRALALRPGEGRLVFLAARRLRQAGEPEAAVAQLVELLVCGSRGKPWHRHEVAAALVETAREAGLVEKAMAGLERPGCAAVSVSTLETYVEGIRKELAGGGGGR
jgi:tetratricopeptide (TPR) repeat protein